MRSFDKAQDENLPDSRLATPLRRLIPAIMAITGIIFIVAGILVNYYKTQQSTALGTVSSDKVGSVAGEIKVKTVVVDISGAIEQPGVYTIPYDSRIANVLITAGGLSPKADRNYISRYINLAQRVSDGMKIYFPFENDTSGNFSGSPVNNLATKLININMASVSELDTLPGIGEVTANKIIAARPYQDISELTSKGAVSKSVFEKIKTLVSVN